MNAASVRAAHRFCFAYEGTWRGDGIVKGHRRDTVWFSILEPEWHARRALFEAWLADGISMRVVEPYIRCHYGIEDYAASDTRLQKFRPSHACDVVTCRARA